MKSPCIFLSLSLYISMYISISLSLYVPVCLSICLSIRKFASVMLQAELWKSWTLSLPPSLKQTTPQVIIPNKTPIHQSSNKSPTVYWTIPSHPKCIEHTVIFHVYIHTYIHAYVHYITLHYVTLHYITLHYITYIHTCIHTYIYLYIYIYKYTYT